MHVEMTVMLPCALEICTQDFQQMFKAVVAGAIPLPSPSQTHTRAHSIAHYLWVSLSRSLALSLSCSLSHSLPCSLSLFSLALSLTCSLALSLSHRVLSRMHRSLTSATPRSRPVCLESRKK